MGFSVTATHAIFFIAMLTAGSAAMNVYFDTARETNEARVTWSRTSESAVDTNLTLSVNACTGGCRPATANVRIDVRNSGTMVVDARNLTFLIDGTAHTFANVSSWSVVAPATVASTDLILPGETMRLDLNGVPITVDYANDGSDLPVQVVTLDGVFGRR